MMYGWGWFWGALMMLVFWGGLVVVIVVAARLFGSDDRRSSRRIGDAGGDPRRTLRQRRDLARGVRAAEEHPSVPTRMKGSWTMSAP